MRRGIGHELGGELTNPGDHAHHHAECAGNGCNAGVFCQFAKALKHTAADTGEANFFIRTEEQEKRLTDGKQTQHDHDEVNASGKPGLIKRIAFGIFDGFQPDGVEKDAKTGERGSNQGLATVGDDHQYDAEQSGEKNLAGPEHWGNTGKHRCHQNKSNDRKYAAKKRC